MKEKTSNQLTSQPQPAEEQQLAELGLLTLWWHAGRLVQPNPAGQPPLPVRQNQNRSVPPLPRLSTAQIIISVIFFVCQIAIFFKIFLPSQSSWTSQELEKITTKDLIPCNI